MSLPADINDRYVAAAVKAEGASEILRFFTNEPEGASIATESGLLISLKEWLRVNEVALGGVPALQAFVNDLQNLADPTKGAAGVARAIRHINDVDELRAISGLYSGEVAYLTSYFNGWAAYATPVTRGHGQVVWDATAEESDDGVTVFQVSGVAVGRWKRPGNHVLSVDDAGLVHESAPTTDQTARVQAFLNAASGRPYCVGRPIKVGCNTTLMMPANIYFLANGFELFTLSTFTGSDAVMFMIINNAVSNVFVNGLIIDGNQAAFGGLYPVVPTAFTRGVAVYGGCENIEYRNLYCHDVVGNATLHFSGGAKERSTNVRWTDCVARNCGLGFAQEIVQGAVILTAEGPGDTVYDNCIADMCNFGLYIAGGKAEIRGGYYHSKRNQCLTVYTGDAHAETHVHFAGSPTFEITPELGSNEVALFHCINKQSAEPEYGTQQFLNVTGDQPRFICNHGGVNTTIEEGCNVRFLAPVFKGGSSCVRTRTSTVPGGPYRQGRIDLGAADMSGFSSDGLRANIAVAATRPVFRDPSSAVAAGVVLNAGANVELIAPEFGATGSAQQPQHGVSTGVSGTRLRISGAVNRGVTGNIFNVTLANSAKWLIVDADDTTKDVSYGKDHLGSTTYDPGSLADGEGVTTTVAVNGANLGDFAQASFSNSLQGVILTSWVSTAGTISVRFQNESGGVIDLASGTLSARSSRPVQ